MKRIKEKIAIMGIITSLLAACAGERPQNLGVHDGRLSPCPNRPNCVSSQEGEPRHRIDPLAFTGDPLAAMERLAALLSKRSDTAIVTQEPHYLRVEFRTTWFVDDGEFLLVGEGGRIEVRSASRLGYSDLGKNRSRIEEIRGAWTGKGEGGQ